MSFEFSELNIRNASMITLIFGAGASWDSENLELRDKGSTPPLGDNLFFRLNNLGGATSRLDDTIKDIFIKKGYEVGIDSLQASNKVLVPILRETADYLSSFSPTTDNAYTRLFKQIRNNITNVTIATLNYDLLIEQSLLNLSIGVSYLCENDYNGAKVIKFHGSSNLVPVMPKNITFINPHFESDKGVFVETNTVEYLRGHNEIVTWIRAQRNDLLAPIMCLYNREKRVLYSKSAMDEIQEKLYHSIGESTALFLIGIKYVHHDTHLWEPILKSNCHIVIFDPYPTTELIEILKNRNGESTIIKNGFYSSTTRITGLINKFLREGK